MLSNLYLRGYLLAQRILIRASKIPKIRGNGPVVYEGSATARGGRTGSVKSSDGVVDVDLTPPRILGGIEAPGSTNPEQLFAATYSSCFLGAMHYMAKTYNKPLPESSTVTAIVRLHTKMGFNITVELVADVPGFSKVDVEYLMYKAYEYCPYSKATMRNIAIKLTPASFIYFGGSSATLYTKVFSSSGKLLDIGMPSLKNISFIFISGLCFLIVFAKL